MKLHLLLAFVLAFASFAPAQTPNRVHATASGGIKIGDDATAQVTFYGGTPIVQPSGAAQTALTDSTGGSTANATLAATAGVHTLSIPIQYASMTTAAADLVTNFTLGYKFKILGVSLVNTTISTGDGASQVINLEIGTTDVTGGAVALTTAACDTLGELTAGSSVTAANTGAADATISVEAASTTAFVEGAGILLIKIQNMDVADNMAKAAELTNALRDALDDLNLIAGE